MNGYKLLCTGAVHVDEDDVVLHVARTQTTVLLWYERKCVLSAENCLVLKAGVERLDRFSLLQSLNGLE